MKTATLLLFMLLAMLSYSQSEELDDFNINMMRSTFLIEGENNSKGTCFIIGNWDGDSIVKQIYLVTAKHVLDGMIGDSANIYLRIRLADSSYKTFKNKFEIRRQGVNQYVSHPTEDVAVIKSYPILNIFDYVIVPEFLLISEVQIKLLKLHPGDNLNVLGYPMGKSYQDTGFPILRSAKISSYPILPISIYKTFLLDFEVFGGNSGGPVYFVDKSNRKINKKYERGQSVNPDFIYQNIIGLVSSEAILKESVRSLNKTELITHKLSLANIVHAKYILETIELAK